MENIDTNIIKKMWDFFPYLKKEKNEAKHKNIEKLMKLLLKVNLLCLGVIVLARNPVVFLLFILLFLPISATIFMKLKKKIDNDYIFKITHKNFIKFISDLENQKEILSYFHQLHDEKAYNIEMTTIENLKLSLANENYIEARNIIMEILLIIKIAEERKSQVEQYEKLIGLVVNKNDKEINFSKEKKNWENIL